VDQNVVIRGITVFNVRQVAGEFLILTKLNQHVRLLISLIFMLIVGLSHPVSASLQPVFQTNTLAGWLNLAYGDPPPDSNLPPLTRTWLTDERGRTLAYLVLDENSARSFKGQQVQVTVQGNDVGTASVSDVPTYNVIDIQPLVNGLQLSEGDVSAQLTGSQSYITVLCSFPDVNSPPHSLSWYQGLMSNTYPGLDHYWRQTSYNNVNLIGSFTTSQWYTMPHPKSYYYLPEGDVKRDSLSQDCVTAANTVTPSINFPSYKGVNLMFDGDLNCCAWGGAIGINVDGQTKRYLATWMPDWADLATIGHEIGHGFGLPHSSGPAANPPTGLNIYVSSWDIMSRSSSYLYSVFDSDYEYLPPGTIAYHRDMLSWIPANRKTSFMPGEARTITLEQLQQPQANSNYLLAKIAIGGSSIHFYTVEARTKTGYDQSIPGAGVIIHRVDVGRPGTAGDALVVDGDTNRNVNDAGAIWLPGEIFNDAANKIQVRVVSSTSTSFTVYISNNVSATAAPSRNFNSTGAPKLSWDGLSWAMGYKVQLDEEMSFDDPVVNMDLPNIQLSLQVSLPDGIYYWRVCAWQTPGVCNAWSTVERLTVKSS
jgi:M6 family metalloprotease-like protein